MDTNDPTLRAAGFWLLVAVFSGLLALAVAFVLTETIWILQFLPLHFIVQTGIIVSLYYACMQIIAAYMESRLTKRLMIELVAAAIIGITLLLLTAHWA